MVYEGTINIILADYDNARIENIMNKVQFHPRIRVIGIADDGNSLIDKIISLRPHAIVMPFSLIDITAISVIKKLEELSIKCFVYVINPDMPSLVKELKAKGVAGVIDINDDIGTIISSSFNRNNDVIDVEVNNCIDTSHEFEQTVILTYNSKGGVGKTTIAINLAVALRRSPVLKDKKIALVDFDIGGANISTLCNISDKKALSKNIFLWNDLTSDTCITDDDVETMMIDYNGLKVLPMPNNFQYAQQINYQLADKVLVLLKKYFDIVVIDGGPNITSPVDAALKHATHVLLVSDTERQSVKQLTRIVDLLTTNPIKQDDYSIVLGKMYVVVNHTQKESEWDLDAIDIARTIGRPLLREIPYCESVKDALHGDSGLQALELDKGKFSSQIRGLADDICEAYPEKVNFNIHARKDKKKLKLFSK